MLKCFSVPCCCCMVLPKIRGHICFNNLCKHKIVGIECKIHLVPIMSNVKLWILFQDVVNDFASCYFVMLCAYFTVRAVQWSYQNSLRKIPRCFTEGLHTNHLEWLHANHLCLKIELHWNVTWWSNFGFENIDMTINYDSVTQWFSRGDKGNDLLPFKWVSRPAFISSNLLLWNLFSRRIHVAGKIVMNLIQLPCTNRQLLI